MKSKINMAEYEQYAAETKRRNEATLSYSDWVGYGSLSYDKLMIKWFGEAKASEMQSKSKVKGEKRTQTIPVAHVGEPSVDMPTRGKTRLVWEIADGLVKDGVSAARNAIIEACIAAGINKATAATQYSAWVRARREAK